MADTSEGTIQFIPEVTFNVTPTTPAFKALRIVGETLTAEYANLVSNQIRGDAMVAEIRRSGVQVAGDINFELAADANFEDMLAGALRGTWATDTLKGGLAKPSYTFERKIVGPSANSYLRFTGSRIAGLSLNLTPDEIITGSFRVEGAGHAAAATIITGATYGAQSVTSPMTGIDVTSLAVAGVSGVDFISMTLEVNNNLRVQKKLSQSAARGIGYGRRVITGTLTCFFEDLTAYNLVLNNTSGSIVATMTDGTDTYALTLGKVRFLNGDAPNPGNDQDFILTMQYQAIYDSVIASDIQITR